MRDAMIQPNDSTKVRAALHVAPDAFFFSGDNGVGFSYHGDDSRGRVCH
jgi:hypothetical protein